MGAAYLAGLAAGYWEGQGRCQTELGQLTGCSSQTIETRKTAENAQRMEKSCAVCTWMGKGRGGIIDADNSDRTIDT